MAIQSRPPVITIMGHVDHGKTTLLDYIRKTQVAAKESGGITQHIGAYQVDFQGKKLTFIDTPGHAAFTKMRERGAKVTDIVVLVVAANDGVKPQTIESIRHIKESNVSVIVAINKTDLPDVYPDVVKSQLAEHDLLVHGFGGEIETVELSATKGTGVDKLLETIAVTAELNNYQADPDAPLEAVVIEASKNPQRGCLATVIVQQGTLKARQEIVSDQVRGRVRSLVTATGEALNSAPPGTPVEIVGFDEVPAVGSVVHEFGRLPEEKVADSTLPDQLSTGLTSIIATSPEISSPVSTSESIDTNAQVTSPTSTSQSTQPTGNVGTPVLGGVQTIPAASSQFDDIDWSQLEFDTILNAKSKIKLVLRADVEGTLEAIKGSLDDESVELISAKVGDVTEADVELADSTGAGILAFRSRVSGRVKQLAKAAGVKIRQYEVIYELIEDLQKQMLKLLEPTIDEVITGEAEILQVFEMRGERIAGIKVKTGELKKHDLFHLKRGDDSIANPVIKSMMHGKQEIDKVTAKSECGLTFKNKKLDFAVGDILVAYRVEE